MKNPPNSSEQALEDYFNDLLGEPAAAKGAAAALPVPDALIGAEELAVPMPPLRTIAPAGSARLAHLPTRGAAPAAVLAGATAATPLRVYAEPVRTLNLRMPLPSPAPRSAVLEAPAAEPFRPQPVAPAAPRREAPVVAEPPVAKAEPAPVEPPAVEAPISVSVEEQAVATAAPAAPAPWLANGRPAWAQRPFECLLFRVGGLGLAAPLAELGSIYKLDPAALTTIFGQAPWFMGLLPVKGYNVRTIDGAQVVMPERYTPDLREQYRFVITLHGSDWGLAVDAVADSIILQPDDVRWRSQRGKRPWLAGTVVDRMCALLDVAQLVWMFENQDGKRSAPRA
jgi:purine-binding chemotaxis protein CheW